MSEINISVVVCAYNEEVELNNCLESIKLEIGVRKDVEVIIVDNESNDRTGEIALDFILRCNNELRVRCLRVKHVSLTSSRNTALSYCRGTYVLFVDGDAAVGKGWLFNLMNKFEDDVGIVAGNVANLHPENIFSDFIYTSHFRCSLDAEHRSKLIGANMGFNKAVLKQIGGFHGANLNRGDETCLTGLYSLKMPEFKTVHAPDSIVYNAFPSSLFEWVKQQYIGGRSNITVLKILGENRIKEHIKVIIKLSSLLFLPHLLLYSMTVHSLFVIHFVVYILRVLYSVKHICCGINRLYKKKRLLQAAMFVPISLLGIFCSDLGAIAEVLRSFNKEIDNKPAPLSSVINDEQSAFYL